MALEARLDSNVIEAEIVSPRSIALVLESRTLEVHREVDVFQKRVFKMDVPNGTFSDNRKSGSWRPGPLESLESHIAACRRSADQRLTYDRFIRPSRHIQGWSDKDEIDRAMRRAET